MSGEPVIEHLVEVISDWLTSDSNTAIRRVIKDALRYRLGTSPFRADAANTLDNIRRDLDDLS